MPRNFLSEEDDKPINPWCSYVPVLVREPLEGSKPLLGRDPLL